MKSKSSKQVKVIGVDAQLHDAALCIGERFCDCCGEMLHSTGVRMFHKVARRGGSLSKNYQFVNFSP